MITGSWPKNSWPLYSWPTNAWPTFLEFVEIAQSVYCSSFGVSFSRSTGVGNNGLDFAMFVNTANYGERYSDSTLVGKIGDKAAEFAEVGSL